MKGLFTLHFMNVLKQIVLLVALLFGALHSKGQFTVDTSSDSIDISPGDGICADSNGECSLRAAIMESNAITGLNNIFIPNNEYLITLNVSSENGCVSGDLDITSDLVIQGELTRETIINADSLDRVFHVLPGVIVTIEHLEIHQGFVFAENGGAILNQGDLSLFEVGIRNSMTEGDTQGAQIGGMGGAIANEGIITIENTTINDCMALGGKGGNGIAPGGGSGGGGGPGFGGAIYNTTDAVGVMVNSTISGNIAIGGRGGSGTHHQGSGVVSSPGGLGGGNGGSAGGQNGNGGVGNWAGGGGGGGSISGAGGDGGFGGGGGGGGANSWGGNSGPSGDGGLYGGNGGQGCCSGGSGGGGGAGLGGGLFNNSGDFSITNCTFAFNEALGGNGGGGWFSGGGAAGSGGGGAIFNLDGNVILNNCLSAENISSDSGRHLAGEMSSTGGHNLVQTSDAEVTFIGVTTGDLLDLNPLIFPLTNNGGNTDTHQVESCDPISPAINAGNDDLASNLDQIGQGRSGISDIGALEVLAPIASLLPMDTVLCIGQSLLLDATVQDGIYNWSNGSTNPTLLVESEDTYTLTVSINGCDFTDNIVVDYSPLESVDLGPDQTLCPGDILTLEPNAVADSYLWNNGSTSTTYPAEISGTYSVIVTLGNCNATDTVLIDNVSPIVIGLGPDQSICEGEQVIFNTDVLADQFIWSSGEITPSITTNSSGVYQLTAEINGCEFSESVALEVIPLPSFNLGIDTQLCQGEILVLNLTNVGDSYTWQDGTTDSSYTVNESGTYSVEVIQNGCAETDEVSVVVNPIPYFDLGADRIICYNENAQIQALASSPNASVTWSTGENTAAISPTLTGTYTATSQLNNCVFSDEIYIEIIPPFELYLGDDMILCTGLTYTIDAWDESFNYPVQINWNDQINDSIRDVTETGLYQIEVISSCESKTDEIFLEFEQCEDCRIYVPNTFTPDNDGINDIFEVSASKCNFNNYNFWIMDRNGDVVFTSQSPDLYWDGSFQQGTHYVEDGIYTWRLLFTFEDEKGTKGEEQFGHILIIR
mgnify:FL=1